MQPITHPIYSYSRGRSEGCLAPQQLLLGEVAEEDHPSERWSSAEAELA